MCIRDRPYTVQSGFEVNVRMAKPDGTYVYNPALEISDTYVLIVLTPVSYTHLYKKDDHGRYVMSAAERQKALIENQIT